MLVTILSNGSLCLPLVVLNWIDKNSTDAAVCLICSLALAEVEALSAEFVVSTEVTEFLFFMPLAAVFQSACAQMEA